MSSHWPKSNRCRSPIHLPSAGVASDERIASQRLRYFANLTNWRTTATLNGILSVRESLGLILAKDRSIYGVAKEKLLIDRHLCSGDRSICVVLSLANKSLCKHSSVRARIGEDAIPGQSFDDVAHAICSPQFRALYGRTQLLSI